MVQIHTQIKSKLHETAFVIFKLVNPEVGFKDSPCGPLLETYSAVVDYKAREIIVGYSNEECVCVDEIVNVGCIHWTKYYNGGGTRVFRVPTVLMPFIAILDAIGVIVFKIKLHLKKRGTDGS